MRVQLLVSEWCHPCRTAEEVWRGVAEQKDFAFEVLDVGQPEGRTVVAKVGLKTVPATVIDGTLKHLGVPTRGEALALVGAAPDKAPTSLRHIGMTLEPTSAWAIAAAALYLVLAGGALVVADGIVGVPPWRGLAIHAFGLGFVTLLIFGLGEHMLPRFMGNPIRLGALAWSQQGLAHAGTILLGAGLYTDHRAIALIGGVLAWMAFALFAARLWPVLAGGAGVGPTDREPIAAG